MKYISSRINQSGLSLIELMIAMVLGLVITGAVIQAFLSSNQTYRMQEAQSRMQENGWAAIHFLTRDIRMADFWGCLPDRSNIDTSLNLLNDPQFNYANISGITGTDNDGFNNSDSININKVAEQNSMLQNDMANRSSNLTVNPGTPLKKDDIVLITDCIAGDIFQISGVGGGSFEHNLNGKKAPKNSSSQLNKKYLTGAQLFRIEPVLYEIDNNAGTPTLYRKRGSSNRQALIENIEQMQILYGENTDNVDGADRYVPLAAVTDMDNVQSVRITLLVRSDTDNLTGTPQSYIFDNFFDNNNANDNYVAGDRRLRQVFTTTIGIRNHLN